MWSGTYCSTSTATQATAVLGSSAILAGRPPKESQAAKLEELPLRRAGRGEAMTDGRDNQAGYQTTFRNATPLIIICPTTRASLPLNFPIPTFTHHTPFKARTGISAYLPQSR